MYVETDFFIALIKDDDWLGEAAQTLYERYQDSLWTSEFTLVELLLVAYREGLNPYRAVNDAASLVEIDGRVNRILTAATYIVELGLTPFDALHAVAARGDTIVSSDDAYASMIDWVDLRSFSNGSRS